MYLKIDVGFEHLMPVDKWINYCWLERIWLCVILVQLKVMIGLKTNICMSCGRMTFKVGLSNGEHCLGTEEDSIWGTSWQCDCSYLCSHVNWMERKALYSTSDDKISLNKNSICRVFLFLHFVGAIIVLSLFKTYQLPFVSKCGAWLDYCFIPTSFICL